MSAGARSGTLEEGQVRAMFDRIAGRLRPDELRHDGGAAPPLARARGRPRARRAGRPRARRRDRHRRPGDRAGAPRRRGGEVVGSDFSEGMLERARAQGAAALRWEQGDALALPYADGEFDAATVGFGARNFSDLAQGLREMARVVRPGRPRRRARDHDADASRRCRRSSALWFDRVVPLLGSSPPTEAYTYLPSSVKRFPGPQALGARDGATRACTTCAGSSPRAGSSRCTHGTRGAADGAAPRRSRRSSRPAGRTSRS